MIHRVIAALLVTAGAACAAGATARSKAGPAVLRELSARCTTFGYISDPAPGLRRLLTSPAVKFVLTESALGRWFANRGNAPSPQAMLDSLYQHLFHVPSELAFGATSASLENWARMLELAVLTRFGHAACNEPTEAATIAPQVRAQVTQVLEAFECPELSVWVRFRREREAADLMKRADDLCAPLAARWPGKLERDPKRIAATLEVAKLLDDAAARALLISRELLSGDDDPAAARMVKALRRLTVQVSLSLAGSGLRVQLGAWPAGLPLQSEALGPLWSATRTPIAFARWDLGAFQEGMSRAQSTFERWKGTAIAAHVTRDDHEDYTGHVRRLVARSRSIPARGTARIDDEPALTCTIRQHDAPPADPITGSSVLPFIPPDAGGVEISTDETLAEHFADQLEKFENQLAKQRAQADAKAAQSGARDGGKTQQQEALETLATAYYQGLGEFRRLVLDEAPAYFAPGRAYLLRRAEKKSRVEVAHKGPDGGRLIVDEVRVPEVAMIGRLRPGAKIDELMKRVTTSVQAGPLPSLTADYSGDLKPTVVVEDGHLIVCYSQRLLKDILAARGGTKRWPLPDPVPAGANAYGVYPGELWLQVTRDFCDFLPKSGTIGNLAWTRNRESLWDLTSFLYCASDALRVLDRVEYWSAPVKGDRATTYRLLSRPPR